MKISCIHRLWIKTSSPMAIYIMNNTMYRTKYKVLNDSIHILHHHTLYIIFTYMHDLPYDYIHLPTKNISLLIIYEDPMLHNNIIYLCILNQIYNIYDYHVLL